MEERELLDKLKDSVVEGDDKEIRKLSQEALDTGVDPYKALMKGCASGMGVMSVKYDRKEAFVPEILLSARAKKLGEMIKWL